MKSIKFLTSFHVSWLDHINTPLYTWVREHSHPCTSKHIHMSMYLALGVQDYTSEYYLHTQVRYRKTIQYYNFKKHLKDYNKNYS